MPRTAVLHKFVVCHQFNAREFTPATVNDADNAFEIQAWHGGLVIHLNAEEIFRGRVPEVPYPANGSMIGLGSPPWPGTGQITYRGLEMRLLREAPPGLPPAPPAKQPQNRVPDFGPVF